MKNQHKIKLFEYSACPFCWKVKALLRFKKIPFESIEVHPLNKKEIQFSIEHKKVPILIDDEGNQVNDSTTIMRHLDQRFSDPSVFDQNAEEEEWLRWSDAVLVKAIPPLIYSSLKDSIKAFDYITKVTKFSPFQKVMIKYSGAIIMRLVSKKSAKKLKISNPKEHFHNCLNEWSKVIEKKDPIKPNGAELAVFGILKSIQHMPAFSIVKSQTDVHHWFTQLDHHISKNFLSSRP